MSESSTRKQEIAEMQEKSNNNKTTGEKETGTTGDFQMKNQIRVRVEPASVKHHNQRR
jgi:hypothetical protein